MWGIVPAAGNGTRIQPLAFSKELLPVGSRLDGDTERPRAVSEYLVERMLRAGADKICFVISPWKSDILQYYGAGIEGAAIAYVVQTEARGLCDAIFRALPLIRPDEPVLVGLPDTIWFPEDALAALPDDRLSFLLFPVDRPELFDAVLTDGTAGCARSRSRRRAPRRAGSGARSRCRARCCTSCTRSGARASGATSISAPWSTPSSPRAARRWRCAPGPGYVDVGTLHGYREAMRLLERPTRRGAGPLARSGARPAGAAGGDQ